MGKTSIVEERPPLLEAPTCQHHWLIETPCGATSMGRCKRCGEEREFRNSASDHLWEDDSRSGYRPWSGVRSVAKATDDEEVAAAPTSVRSAALVL